MRSRAIIVILSWLAASVAQSATIQDIVVNSVDKRYNDAVLGKKLTPIVLDLAADAAANQCRQALENPQIVCEVDGSCLVEAIGINNPDFLDPGMTRGESFYVFKRSSNGVISRPQDPAMAFPRSVPPQRNWGETGGFGGGAAIFSTGEEATTGYRYFSAVNLGNFAERKYGFAWAASRDGVAWVMLDEGGQETLDPNDAHMFVYPYDYRGGVYGGSIWHPAGYYNPADRKFYLFFGLSGLQGIHVQLVRIGFHSEKKFGIDFSDMDVWVASSGRFEKFDGVFTAAQDALGIDMTGDREAVPFAVDVMSITPLRNQDGSDGGFIVLYRSIRQGPWDSDFTYRYAPSLTPLSSPVSIDGKLYPFSWSDQKSVGVTVLDNMTLTRCGPGGYFMALGQDGFQPDGKPRLFGYVTTATKQCITTNGNQQSVCGVTSLLPVRMLVK